MFIQGQHHPCASNRTLAYNTKERLRYKYFTQSYFRLKDGVSPNSWAFLPSLIPINLRGRIRKQNALPITTSS